MINNNDIDQKFSPWVARLEGISMALSRFAVRWHALFCLIANEDFAAEQAMSADAAREQARLDEIEDEGQLKEALELTRTSNKNQSPTFASASHS